MMEKRYLNPAQNEILIVRPKDLTVVAARGIGKSFGMDGTRTKDAIDSMPGSLMGLMSPTYSKLVQNTLPAICDAWERWGYKRDVHYVIGKQPPKKLGFQKCKSNIISWENIIQWYNGSAMVMISFDRPMSANSMSLQHLFGFEARYLNPKKFPEVMPALRGHREIFSECPLYRGVTMTTDMPQLKSEMWVLDRKKHMDPDLIDIIKQVFMEVRLFQQNKDDYAAEYYKKKLRELIKELNQYRSVAHMYAEYDVLSNIEVLGEEYIRDNKRELTPRMYAIQIWNQRPGKPENGFYSALRSDIHYYEKSNYSYLESLDFDFTRTKSAGCRADGDLVAKQPLIIAMDYNAAINTLVCGQVIDRELRTLKDFFVKTPQKIKDVVNSFCDYYHGHESRDVIYYYDHTAVGQDAARDQSFSDMVISQLRSRGWKVKPVYIGQALKHHRKHMMIDLALKGDPKYLFPCFNKENCHTLLVSMEAAGIRTSTNGFEKDKSAEKSPDSYEEPDEYKTHLTDAWDTLFIGCTMYPVKSFAASVGKTAIV